MGRKNTYNLQITPNEYQVRLFLKQALDFESRSAYVISLEATDSSDRPLRALASVAAAIWDVQDQPPVFLNAPFSATVPENTAPVCKMKLSFLLYSKQSR